MELEKSAVDENFVEDEAIKRIEKDWRILFHEYQYDIHIKKTIFYAGVCEK